MTPAEVLTKAADVLDEYGWCQGASVDSMNRHCVLGAINYVILTTGPSDWQIAVDALDERVADVASWNDTPGRTKDQAVALLRHTAQAIR